jgi:tetratricopeptide (TPR) repeat protein/tRNA A-37 threonylcarbamoyl transferase component Bud32
MNACPDDEVLARLVDHALSGEEHEHVVQHLSTCEACRLVTSLLSPISRTVESPHRDHRPEPEQPITLGRYRVLRQVGAGAMGLVYEANDPTLSRRVALKVLRGAADATSRERLEREARAMAQLAHRNVAMVFDVGAVGTRSWVAMEFIEGETLREWWSKHPSDEERVEKLLDAGRGLAAAHAVGLVHRDFKPDNVLVEKTGRAVVTDFGLARTVNAETPAEELQALIGTPAYMSLEQLDRKVADAASDQFAFCVTAIESFAKRRPFTATTWDGLRAAVKAGPEPSVLESVPARLRPMITRGLSADPSSRFPSMAELLSALETAWKGPAVRRRRALVAAGVATLVGVTAVVARPTPCVGISIGEVWSPQRRARIEATLGKEAAPALVKLVLADLDTYATGWAAAQTAACTATRVRGEQTDAMLEQRTSCLAQRRREFDAVTSLLEKPDATVLAQAPGLTGRLAALSSCEDLEALGSERPLPENPAQREAVLAIRDELAKAFALREAGRELEALALAQSASTKLTTIDYPPLRAEAKFRLGLAQFDLARFDEANATLREVVVLATSTRQDRLAARALAATMANLARAERTTPEFDSTLQLAFATLTRVERAEGRDLDALLTDEATVRLFQGRLEEATTACEKVVALRERLLGPNHPRVADALMALAAVYDEHAKPLKALELFERADTILRATVGEKHPSRHKLLTDRALLFSNLGKKAEAIAGHEQALALATELYGGKGKLVGISLANLAYEKTEIDSKGAIELFEKARGVFLEAEGEDSASVVRTNLNIGVEYARLNQPELARAYIEKALATRLKVLGPDHRDTARAMSTMGSVLGQTGNLAEARPYFEKAAAILAKVHGDTHPQVAVAYDRLAQVAEGLGEWDRCVVAIDTALAGRRGYEVPDTMRIARALIVRGRCEEKQGHFDSAKKAGEEALTLIKDNAYDTGEAHFMLAQVARGQKNKAAMKEHVKRAEAAFAAAGPMGARSLAEVRRLK